MIKISQVIVVEGKYDENKLKQIVDACIIRTDGFGVFKRDELKRLLVRLAHERGVIVLTDSDSAGFLIRNHLRGVLPKECVRHAYIPQIKGKERRKEHGGADGFLGVEGVSDELIITALEKAGATSDGRDTMHLTKAEFYADGFSGRPDSASLREKLAAELGFPVTMSANALLEAINLLITREEYERIKAAL